MRAFFGLTASYINEVYEMFFLMKEICNWSFFELYSLPVKLRDWFWRRTIKHKQEIQQNKK